MSLVAGFWLALFLAQQPAAPAPIGRLIDVDGHRVHLYCTGQGSPTVFVAGAFSIDWALVQPQIAKQTRICTYDVAGTAWSDPGPSLTCPDRVKEIHTLLQNAGVTGPFVFTGLSVGALVARFYAREYPGEVSSVVIVDHAFTPKAAPAPVASNATGDSPPALLEMTPILLSTEDTSNFSKLPEPVRELHRWAASRQPAVDHAATADDCETRLNATPAAYPLGDRPLVVISTGNTAPGYKDLQTSLLKLSRHSSQIMAYRSFHSVEIDQPEIVVEAIRKAIGRQ
jgi:pimeloyl-ACP methyl ester carboxylesterase